MFFKDYRWAIGFGIFLLYSFGIWHLSSRYSEASFLQEKLEMATRILEETSKFNELNDTISATIQEQLAKIKQNNVTINKEIQREIIQNPVYSDCRNPDSVMQQYEQKLDNQ